MYYITHSNIFSENMENPKFTLLCHKSPIKVMFMNKLQPEFYFLLRTNFLHSPLLGTNVKTISHI